jgi:hypothetical protein
MFLATGLQAARIMPEVEDYSDDQRLLFAYLLCIAATYRFVGGSCHTKFLWALANGVPGNRIGIGIMDRDWDLEIRKQKFALPIPSGNTAASSQ